MRAMQSRTMPVIGQQASTAGLQSTTIPAQTNGGIDINSIMNLMLVMVVMVMMMKMMGSVTQSI